MRVGGCWRGAVEMNVCELNEADSAFLIRICFASHKSASATPSPSILSVISIRPHLSTRRVAASGGAQSSHCASADSGFPLYLFVSSALYSTAMPTMNTLRMTFSY